MNGSIVVTGAARGIGRAISDRLAANPSFEVIEVDLAPELTMAENVRPVQVDLTTDSGVAEVQRAVEELGLPLLGLVNNAGITRDKRLINMTDDEFASVLDVNLGAAFRLSTRLADSFTDGGSIVNIASRAYLGNFGQFNYSMSKGGVVGLTRAMALDLAPHLRVNAVAPGLIGTEMAMAIPEDVLEKMVSAIPLDRMGHPRRSPMSFGFCSLLCLHTSPATWWSSVEGEVCLSVSSGCSADEVGEDWALVARPRTQA